MCRFQPTKGRHKEQRTETMQNDPATVLDDMLSMHVLSLFQKANELPIACYGLWGVQDFPRCSVRGKSAGGQGLAPDHYGEQVKDWSSASG